MSSYNKSYGGKKGPSKPSKRDWKFERREEREPYFEYAMRQTERGFLIKPRSLMTDLGLMRNITQPQLEDILDGQYQLAKSRNNKKWIQDARREAKAIQLMSDHWIDTVLPSTSREPVPKRRTKSSGAATSYDGSMCRNFRLDRDPSIEVYRSNAAESTSDVPSVSVNIAETAEPLDLTTKNLVPSPIREDSSIISTNISTSNVSNKSTDVKPSDSTTVSDLQITVQVPELPDIDVIPTSEPSPRRQRQIGVKNRALEVPVSVHSVKKQKLSEDLPSDTIYVIRSGSSICPFPGCGARDRKMKRHVFRSHIPSIFFDHQKKGISSQLHEQRIQSLEALAKCIVGPSGTLMQLVDVINNSSRLPEQSEVQPEIATQMAALCRHAGWPVPSKFDLHPVNSSAVLIHWRCLSVLMYNLTAKQRNEFRNNGLLQPEDVTDDRVSDEEFEMAVIDECGASDQSDDNAASDENNNVSTSYAPATVTGPAVLRAMDCHFHLDRTSNKIWNSCRNKSPEDIISYVSGNGTPRLPVSVEYGVVVYSEPRNYPSDLNFGKQWTVAVGVHPKHVHEMDDQKFLELRRLLDLPCVSALGEIGLDHTVPLDKWRTQERVFVKVLSLTKVSRPIVLHLRGPASDRYGLGVSSRCIQLLQKNVVSPRQLIHLHCFSGDSELVAEWLTEFPNVYFGYTALVSSFTPAQIAGLRSVPKDRILVETDSPYFARFDVNTPAFIGEVAQLVADHRGIPVEELLEITLQNGRELYNV